jgi:putative RNA 2'-phosphotransferase
VNSIDSIQLSKTVSHALRHEPQSYNIKLDREGWVSIFELVQALKNKGFNIEQEDIVQMVEKSEKKRHQISNGRIRAYYGHSTNEKIVKQPQSPPDTLYHGTIANNLSDIMLHGLLPMERQYVHLSTDEETAKLVANRRKGEIVILKIKAQEAYKNGILFYKEENNIWLSEPIPSKYITD